MYEFWNGWLASESTDHDAIKVKRAYIDLNEGNLHDGILFSQIMYWHGNSREDGKPRLRVQKEGELWLAKRYEDWWEECRINEDTARRCIERMCDRKLIIKKVFMFDGKPMVHIRVDKEVFSHEMNYLLFEKSSLICSMVTDGNVQNEQNDMLPENVSITESTSKTTSVHSEELQKIPATTSQKKAEKKTAHTKQQRRAYHPLPGYTEEDKPPKKIWTALEDKLMRSSSATKISDAQRNQLDEDRLYTLGNPPVDKRMQSANDLYDTNSEFKKFADERIDYLNSENVRAVGTMIDQICNYTSKKGWFYHERITSKPSSFPEQGNIPKLEPILDAPGHGFVPGMKTVKDLYKETENE